MTIGRIVIVDDSPLNRMLLTGILEQAGYEVREAAGGAEALDLVRADTPELILLDIQMPDMSGYDTCRQLKASPRLAAIPVIFISALDDVFDKVAAFDAGGSDYVTKPFEPAEVLARVRSQLKLFRLQNELREKNLDLQRRNEQLVLAQQRTERVFLAFADALPGTVLAETYRLETKIGEGGFGAVFRGVHLRLRRPVAVKVLRPTAGRDSLEELERFRREGIAACRVAHPNAVEVLDFGISSRNMAYLVMELLEGKTLGALLTERRIIDIDRAAAIIGPVCEALGAAHNAGIVHRDIKPDNVFLHRSGDREVVKVVDFGIARLMDDGGSRDVALTQRGHLIGTPLYMAPERLLGEPYDSRSDVYSVGVLLYQMLCGDLPFAMTKADMPEMMRMHLTSAPRPLREVNASIPEPVADLVMRALARDPRHRPTVRELGALRQGSAGVLAG